MAFQQNPHHCCTKFLFLKLKSHWKIILILVSIILTQILYHQGGGRGHNSSTKVYHNGLRISSQEIINTASLPFLQHINHTGTNTRFTESVSKLLERVNTLKHSNSSSSRDSRKTNHTVYYFSSGAKSKSGKQLPKNPISITLKYHSNTVQYRHKFDCNAIFNGSKSEIQKVQDFFQIDRPKDGGYPLLIKPEVLSDMFYDCAAYKKIRGYVQDEGTPEERDFPLAYVILAHQDFDHLERLFRILYRPQHVFCIHLDKKAPDNLKKAVSTLASCFPNTHLASDPQNVLYAHMSRLMADYTCMRDLVKQNRPWKYLINMAATSLPLQTNKEIVKHLKHLKGKNDMNMRFELRMPKRWVVEYFIDWKGIIWPSKRTMAPAPHNLTLTKGLAYNSFSRPFLQWVMADQIALDFLKWCNKTYSPDEHYWATLNNLYHNTQLNTPGGYKGHPDTYRDSTILARYVGRGQPCGGRKVHNFCLFGSEDLSDLRSKPWCMTANKFDLLYDPVAYSCVEEWLENKTVAGRVDMDYTRERMVFGKCLNI